jgi:transposase
MEVMIGVDPHKRSHTATMLDRSELELKRITVRAGRRQVEQLLEWADGQAQRIWAVESAGGMGYLLAQQLVAAGETVLDVPATLASRVRVLSTGQSTKSDPNDARSVAVAALRAPTVATVHPADHVTVCRLLAKRHTDLARWRPKLCCRLHALVTELVPGGISKEVVVNQARSLLEAIQPQDVAALERHRQAGELVDEIEHRDSRARITVAVTASQTTLMEIFGVGPIVAAMLIGFSGDPTRFATASRYAAYTGTAPVEFSSGGPPAVPTRQPPTEPRPALRGDHPDPSTAQLRPPLLRTQARRRQDPPRSDPCAQTAAATSSGGTSSPMPSAPPRADQQVPAGHSRNVSVARVTGSHLHTGSSAKTPPGP